MLHIYNVICNVEYILHARNNIRYNLDIFNIYNIVCMSIMCVYKYIQTNMTGCIRPIITQLHY